MKREKPWSMSLLAAALLLASPWSVAAGELWETRSSMEGAAFGRMELGTNRECRPANWRDKPEFKAPGDDGECRAKVVERRGASYAWKFDCGKTKGTGSARQIGNDRLEGLVEMDTPDGHFVLRMNARKLGTCEPPGRG